MPLGGSRGVSDLSSDFPLIRPSSAGAGMAQGDQLCRLDRFPRPQVVGSARGQVKFVCACAHDSALRETNPLFEHVLKDALNPGELITLSGLLHVVLEKDRLGSRRLLESPDSNLRLLLVRADSL